LVWGVAETPHGNLLLTGSRTRAWVRDRAGREVRAWSSRDAAARLENAYQPLVSAEGAVLVADKGDWSGDGGGVALFGSDESFVHRLALSEAPFGVALLPSGLIVVSTRGDGRLHFLRVRRP
jgi:hypothetical protein